MQRRNKKTGRFESGTRKRPNNSNEVFSKSSKHDESAGRGNKNERSDNRTRGKLPNLSSSPNGRQSFQPKGITNDTKRKNSVNRKLSNEPIKRKNKPVKVETRKRIIDGGTVSIRRTIRASIDRKRIPTKEKPSAVAVSNERVKYDKKRGTAKRPTINVVNNRKKTREGKGGTYKHSRNNSRRVYSPPRKLPKVQGKRGKTPTISRKPPAPAKRPKTPREKAYEKELTRLRAELDALKRKKRPVKRSTRKPTPVKVRTGAGGKGKKATRPRLIRPVPRLPSKKAPEKIYNFKEVFRGNVVETRVGYFVVIHAKVGAGWATESTPVFDDDDETWHRVVWRTKVFRSEKEAFTAYFDLLGDQQVMSELQAIPYSILGGELTALYTDWSIVTVEKWGKNGPK